MAEMKASCVFAGLITAILGVLPTPAAADDSLPPMGYRPSPKGGVVVRRVADAKSRSPLRGAAKRSLPTRWDAREQGWLSPVKSQGTVGACWSFAACATIETQLLKRGRGLHDFSEKNMVNLHGWEWGPNDGGNNDVAAGYLLRWGGAVAETNDVYIKALSSWTSSSPLMPAVHVQHVVWTPPLDGTQESIDALKAALVDYGAISTAICWNSAYEKGAAYYHPVTKDQNHAITLVGWDDAYPTNNFKTAPPGPGAWIIKNSWGKLNGESGYYYVSYHDATFARDDFGAVFIPAEEGEDYDAVRGHDRLGAVYDVSQTYWDDPASQYDLQAAVFSATWNEQLAAIGLWTSTSPNPYELSIYTNVTRGGASPIAGGILARRQTGVLQHAGFTTVPLETPLALDDGASFAIVYRQTGTERSTLVNCSIVGICYPVHARGNSFFGRDGGDGTVEWLDGVDEAVNVDVTDITWGACIKAYTRTLAAAPSGDAPTATEIGTAFLADLAETNAVLFAETGETFGAAAGLVGANGRTLWASWLAGLDPSDSDDRDFTVSITISNGVPRLSWRPDLGGRRTYAIWGRETLGNDAEWVPVSQEALATSPARFFKVTVDQNQ